MARASAVEITVLSGIMIATLIAAGTTMMMIAATTVHYSVHDDCHCCSGADEDVDSALIDFDDDGSYEGECYIDDRYDRMWTMARNLIRFLKRITADDWR